MQIISYVNTDHFIQAEPPISDKHTYVRQKLKMVIHVYIFECMYNSHLIPKKQCVWYVLGVIYLFVLLLFSFCCCFCFVVVFVFVVISLGTHMITLSQPFSW